MVVHVHAGHADLDLVADPVDLRRAFPDQRHMLLVEMVIVIRHRAKPDQPFHRVLQLDEHAEARDAADNAREFLPYLIQHVLRFLQLFRVALRLHGDTLPLGRLLRDILHAAGQVLHPRLA
ncbi:hypothetical protein D3C74_268020 [compost metagenome]